MSVQVLLVDDHPIVRSGLRSLIDGQSGVTVIAEAGDGNEGIAVARDLKPDVVVMDVSMAGLNGIEATRRIVAELPDVRVLCFSARADQQVVSAMLQAGASGYVLKGVGSDEVVEAIIAVASQKTYLSPAVADLVVRDYVSQLSVSARGPNLTSREREVLQLIAEGHATGAIADRLTISPKTVATHREHIMAKLKIHNIAGLVKYAIREGISTSARHPD